MRWPHQETAPGPLTFHNEELPEEIGAGFTLAKTAALPDSQARPRSGKHPHRFGQTIADELSLPFEKRSDGDRRIPRDAVYAARFGSRTTPTITPQFAARSCFCARSLVGVAARNGMSSRRD